MTRAEDADDPAREQRCNKILLVDDAPENLRILSECLRDKYTIMFAKNGPDALRLARYQPPPDLILLDVIMPGMDGYEVCRKLRDETQTRDIPIMFITAQNEETDEAKGLSLGAQDYITKPFRSSLVRNRVANQLKYKRYRDHLNDMVFERTHQLALTQEATIHAMASLAEWRDTETGAHIKRTQNYVKTLALYISQLPQYRDELDLDSISWLYLSAPLHDVGKVAIADTVLHKPGPLTDEEYEAMKEHTTHGRAVLASADKFLGENSFLRIASDIAYCHHERWDGKGYPRGLSGREIPLSARLMSVADVYDALRSKRVYKPSMPHETAVRIIVDGRGTQFDPDIVDAFVALQEDFRNIASKYSDM
ncbi:response regulator [Desulfovibrio desulfuricans]|uniref:Response regulator n=1 Tax=Desulfovibrio desulfuricans TaxID=876 RepID=A0A4P7UHZ8_DESDE|nr:HD domain-containing phosphohydrolase [Desulfovibrio desulfuricans]QCC85965.1 response regulator [Desulfovibrio desulfuricans]